MIEYSKIITEDIETLLQIERKESCGKLRDRVRMLRLLKSGESRSLPAVAPMIGLKTAQVRNLFSRYRKEGLSGLCKWRYQGNHRKITVADEAKVLQECATRENGFRSQAEAQEYISTTFKVNLSQPGISLLFSRNRVKLKTGRPLNVKTIAAEQEEYKKNSRRK